MTPTQIDTSRKKKAPQGNISQWILMDLEEGTIHLFSDLLAARVFLTRFQDLSRIASDRRKCFYYMRYYTCYFEILQG
jgi:hypothetical protein